MAVFCGSSLFEFPEPSLSRLFTSSPSVPISKGGGFSFCVLTSPDYKLLEGKHRVSYFFIFPSVYIGSLSG